MADPLMALFQQGGDSPQLEEMVNWPSWMADGLCLEYPDVDFFPDRGQDARPAKQVCAACLVRAECLNYAFVNGQRHGIWGGSSERERRRLRQSAA